MSGATSARWTAGIFTADFDTWVRAVFDHPTGKPEWYWAPDFDNTWDALRLTDAVTVAYLHQLDRPRVTQAIDAFLAGSHDVSERVRLYAGAARAGLAL